MHLNYLCVDDILKLKLSGNYILYNNSKEKTNLFNSINNNDIKKIYINGEKLDKWDSTLVVVIYNILKIAHDKNIELDITKLPNGLKRLLKLAFSTNRTPPLKENLDVDFIESTGIVFIGWITSFNFGLIFLKESLKSIKKFVLSKAVMRKEDLLFAIEECSYKAVPIITLISFMVGLILAFVGSIQLKVFGAELYVASLVSIAMVRIMGAVMTGIIISGRTGASYAASIGTMQVNEEIDALKTMGISVIDFLLLPRILALVITMPFLTLLSDIMGIIGGAFVGIFILNISPYEYYKMSINVLSLGNFLIGIFHGFVFGCVIAISGCYYGIKCGKDAESVGKSTTKSVVASIVWIIIATGIITLLCEVIKI